MHPDDFLLLPKNTVLEQHLIDQLDNVEREESGGIEIYVLQKPTEK